MAISFTIETRRIEVGKNGFFDVRGINTEDMTYLTLNYLDDMKAAVAQYGKGALRGNDVADVVQKVVREFSELSHEIISRCADAETDEERENFRRLTFPHALKALKAIFDLTMQDGGVDLGNFWGAIARLLEVNGLNLGSVGNQLNDIISSAENMSRPSPAEVN